MAAAAAVAQQLTLVAAVHGIAPEQLAVAVQRSSSFVFVLVLFVQRVVVVAVAAAVAVEVAAAVIVALTIYMDFEWLMVAYAMVEAHSLADNNNCHLNSPRPTDECAHLDRMWVHHNDAMEWAVHLNRLVSCVHHSELTVHQQMIASDLNDRHHANTKCDAHRPHACPYLMRFVHHFHADYNLNVLPIYYPTNKVNSLRASMAVDTHSIGR